MPARTISGRFRLVAATIRTSTRSTILAFLVVKRLPDLIENFRPPEGVFLDLVGVAVRPKFWIGHPIYEEQSVSFNSNFAGNPHDVSLQRPPAGIGALRPAICTEELSRFHLRWNAVGVMLFLSAIGLIARDTVSFRLWHFVPIAAILVWSFHVRDTINMGQLNFFLAFFLTLAWVCDRRGYTIAREYLWVWRPR